MSFNNPQGIFGMNQSQTKLPFFGGNQQQQVNPLQNQSIFTSSQPQGAIFGNQPQGQPQGGMFGNQLQQSTLFGNQQQQSQGQNFLNQNPQAQQRSSIFNQQIGNQPQQSGNLFGNQQQGMNFLGNQQQQTPNLFGNQFQQTGSFVGNQQQQGQNMYGNQQQGQNLYGNQQQQGGIYGNNPNQYGSVIINPQQQLGQNYFGTKQQQILNNFLGHQLPDMNLILGFDRKQFNQMEQTKYQIQAFCRRIDARNLQIIKIDDMNMYKNYRIADLSTENKQAIMVIINNMVELKTFVNNIKKENQLLDQKAQQYIKNVQEKLIKYKECLIQNIQQSNLLSEIKEQVQMLENQIKQFIIPMYNAFKSGVSHSFDSPDEFTANISKKILQKMIQLNNKVDEIIACQQMNPTQQIPDQESSALLVLEQLLNYYENVSAKILQFSKRYKQLKRNQIQKYKRSSSYEQVMKRIEDKVNKKIGKEFKCYDLIKNIEQKLEEREKRQHELNNTANRNLI